jgi:phosphoserine aminotransferase
MARIFNFNAGPSTLPLEVLEKAQAEFLDYQGTGMSLMELSHRSPEYDAVHNDTQILLRELMGIPNNYKIIFIGGGASTQFAMAPLNFIPDGGSADYVVTGAWSQKALKEAIKIANGKSAASSEETNFSYIPGQEQLDLDPNAAYVHITSNNTIFGTQYFNYPDVGGKPLVADMSSDILCKEIDVSKFSLIYAGAQKNLGPSGVAVAIIKDEFVATENSGLPTMLRYSTHISKNSLFNTPPTFPIYIIKLVLEWIKAQGGVSAVEAVNVQKADLLYGAIDGSDGYYKGTTAKDSRSWMNVTMRLNSEDLEKQFIAQAKTQGLGGLKGHRDVGGIRVSMYNAMPLAGITKLVDFMTVFKAKN